MDCDVESTVEFNLDLGAVLQVLTLQLSSDFVPTRLAVLRWVLLLLQKTPNKVSERAVGVVFPMTEWNSEPADYEQLRS